MVIANEISPSSSCLSSSTTSLASSITTALSIILHLQACVGEVGNGRLDLKALAVAKLTGHKGSNGNMAISVELRLRPIPALEYSHDQRHLPLEATNHACHLSRVCTPVLKEEK